MQTPSALSLFSSFLMGLGAAGQDWFVHPHDGHPVAVLQTAFVVLGQSRPSLAELSVFATNADLIFDSNDLIFRRGSRRGGGGVAKPMLGP